MNKSRMIIVLVISTMVTAQMYAAATAEVERKQKKAKELVVARSKKDKKTEYKIARRRSTGSIKKHKELDSLDILSREKVDPRELKRLQQRENTPIMKAVYAHDIREVERLVKTGSINLGYQNHAKQTPLMIASGEGLYCTIEFLVHANPGAINLRDSKGDTALIYALRAGHDPEVKLLLEKKADPTLSGDEGKTPLMIAVATNYGKCIELVLKSLATHGAITLKKELNRVDKSGDTALQIALIVKAKEAQRLLIHAYGDVDIKAVELINAAKAGNEKEVDELLATKVDVNYVYADQTPLLAALHAEGPEAMLKIVTKLINAGAQVNVTDRDGYTALSLIASRHFDSDRITRRMKDSPEMSAIQGDIIDKLLGAGAEIDGDNKTIKATPLMCAIDRYNGYIAQLLIDRGARQDPKSRAPSELVHRVLQDKRIIDNPDQSVLRQWKRIGYYVDSHWKSLAHKFLNTPEGKLFTAINNGNEKEVAEYITHHPDCVKWVDYRGNTPLSIAIERNDVAIMKLLLKAGANKNEQYIFGLSPLMLALRENCIEAAFLLLMNRVKINAVDNNGNSALMFLASSLLSNDYYCDLADVLLKLDANVMIRNIKGQTAADIAAENSRADEEIRAAIVNKLEAPESKRGRQLIEAIPKMDREKIHELLNDEDTDVSYQMPENGMSALLAATQLNDPTLVSHLLQAEADTSAQHFKTGDTALMVAVARKNYEIVNMLLATNPGIVTLKNVKKQTALDIAKKGGNKQIIDRLEKAQKEFDEKQKSSQTEQKR